MTHMLAPLKSYEEGGYGVLRNYVEAYKWYDIAAAHKFLDTKTRY